MSAVLKCLEARGLEIVNSETSGIKPAPLIAFESRPSLLQYSSNQSGNPIFGDATAIISEAVWFRLTRQ